MENIQKLLPQDKFDTSTINDFMNLREEEIQAVVPDLIEWLADFNWPIADKIAQVLALHPDLVIKELKNYLDVQANDDILKYWLLERLVPLFEKEKQILLIPTLQRIVKEPTQGETDEFVAESAQELLVKLIK